MGAQVLDIPIEIDLLLLGFNGEGGYHYSLNTEVLHEMLSSQFVGADLCPRVSDAPSHFC
jgi:hypothetical protein